MLVKEIMGRQYREKKIHMKEEKKEMTYYSIVKKSNATKKI